MANQMSPSKISRKLRKGKVMVTEDSYVELDKKTEGREENKKTLAHWKSFDDSVGRRINNTG